MPAVVDCVFSKRQLSGEKAITAAERAVLTAGLSWNPASFGFLPQFLQSSPLIPEFPVAAVSTLRCC